MNQYRADAVVVVVVVVAVVAVLSALFGYYLIQPHHTRTVYRTPAACTKAALLAEQAELDWQKRDAAHVDVEGSALDHTSVRDFRRQLAALPQLPQPVDLGACAR